MIPTWARVGAKIVCVLQIHGPARSDVQFPTVKEEYTIREVQLFAEGAGLHLVEITNPVMFTDKGLLEPYFHISAFRPRGPLESDLEAHFVQFLRAPVSQEKIDG
jgi:hypothetical protein